MVYPFTTFKFNISVYSKNGGSHALKCFKLNCLVFVKSSCKHISQTSEATVTWQVSVSHAECTHGINSSILGVK